MGRLVWFNAGSALSSGGLASMGLLTTHTAACCAALSWMAMECICEGHPTMLGIVSGSIGGLVSITPACGFVDFTGAVVIGICGGIGTYFGVHNPNRNPNLDIGAMGLTTDERNQSCLCIVEAALFWSR